MPNKSERILGIDPGYDRMGIAIVENNILLYSACFETSRKNQHADRLVSISQELGRIIDIHKPTVLSIETLFFTNNQKTAMKVAEARGIVLCEARKNGLEIFELSPLQVKIAVTGYGKSDKSQVTSMVQKLIKIAKSNMKDDEFDAIAIAIAGAASYPQSRALLQKK